MDMQRDAHWSLGIITATLADTTSPSLGEMEWERIKGQIEGEKKQEENETRIRNARA